MNDSIESSIRNKLNDAFWPVRLEIVDESDKHAGHAGARPGGQTHYRVTIVSSAFEGLSRVARQRNIYGLLEKEFAEGLHALALLTLTPDEASKRN